MKKILLLLTVTLTLFLSACSESGAVEGTWYSVTDATMYNFQNSEITVSGVIVGQYEDNGESIVISLIDSNENMQLFITTMNDMDVLADVKDGNGTVYFCRGLENATAFIEAAKEQSFQKYIEENLFGTWNALSSEATFDCIEITEDYQFIVHKGNQQSSQHWISLDIGRILEDQGSYKTGDLCAFLTVADDENGTNAWELPIAPTEEVYNNRLKFGEIYMIKDET